MDWATDIEELGSELLEASWNGVPFYMPDSRHSVGRRVQRFFFPGQDETAFQDLGAFDGPMRVSGILIGDRYIHYARQMEQALRAAGPGTLVHPWLGELAMVLMEPATLTFDQRQRRMVTFEATFAPFLPPQAEETSTLDALLDLGAAVLADGRAYLRAALAPVATGIWLARQVVSYAGQAQGVWQAITGASPGGVTGAAGNPVLSAAVAGPVAALSGVAGLTADAEYGGRVADLLAAPAAAVAACSVAVQTPAVGPGDAAQSSAVIDGRTTMAVLLAASAAARGQFAGPGVTPAMALAQAAFCAAQAARASADIAWESRQEAQAGLARLLAEIDAVAAQAALAAAPTVSAAAAGVQAGLLWMGLQDARQALVADLTSAIGRLPAVERRTLAAPVSAWMVANIVAGDTPGQIVAAYADIVARNGVANPALVGPGEIEVLAAAGLARLPAAAA